MVNIINCVYMPSTVVTRCIKSKESPNIVNHKHSLYTGCIIIMMELTGEGRACIPVGLTKT